MKFLTICFLIFYLIMLFEKKGFTNLVNKIIDIDSSEITEILLGDNGKDKSDIFKFIIFGSISVVMSIIEIFYMFFALTYLPKIVGIGYIILWICLFIRNIIKHKKDKNRKLEGGLLNYIISIVDVLYYLCMIKVLFL